MEEDQDFIIWDPGANHPQFEIIQNHIKRAVYDLFLISFRNEPENLVFVFSTEDQIDFFIERMLNYWGSKEVGTFMKDLMRPGASVDWKEHLKKNLGSEMSAKSMVNYFSPLMDYLKKVNEGRTCTLPESL